MEPLRLQFNELHTLYKMLYESLVTVTNHPLIKQKIKADASFDPMSTKRDVYEQIVFMLEHYQGYDRPLNFFDLSALLSWTEREAKLTKTINSVVASGLSGDGSVKMVQSVEWAEFMLRLVVLMDNVKAIS